MKPCKIPPPLQPGDLLRVVAPCGAMREFEAFHKGVEIWRDRGYKVEISSSIDKRWGYLAGTDEIRREQLLESWIDPNVKGILCARGGYGSARLLEDWHWGNGETRGGGEAGTRGDGETRGGGDAGRRGDGETRGRGDAGTRGDGETRGGGDAGRRGEERWDVQLPITNYQLPKWLIGFSDVTGLLWSLYKRGISAVHGPLMTTIAQEPDWSLQRLFNWVEKHELAPLKGIGWGGGKVSGILLPANFTVATHLLGTPIQPGLDNAILALEDVTEAPYRIDRMLTQWRLCGALKKVRGIALGRFSRCEPLAGIPSFSVEEVLRDRLEDLSLPIISDLPFGHDGVNAALPVGIMAHLDADAGILSF